MQTLTPFPNPALTFAVPTRSVLFITSSTEGFETVYWPCIYSRAFPPQAGAPSLQQISVLDLTMRRAPSIIRPSVILAGIDDGYTSLHHAHGISDHFGGGIPVVALASRPHPLQIDHLKLLKVNAIMLADTNLQNALSMRQLVEKYLPIHIEIYKLFTREQVLRPVLYELPGEPEQDSPPKAA